MSVFTNGRRGNGIISLEQSAFEFFCYNQQMNSYLS